MILKFKNFHFPVCYIVFFSTKLRTDEDYFPAGTEILLIILLVMDLFQGLGCGTIEFKLEYVDVLFRLSHGVNATGARTGFRFYEQPDEPEYYEENRLIVFFAFNLNVARYIVKKNSSFFSSSRQYCLHQAYPLFQRHTLPHFPC